MKLVGKILAAGALALMLSVGAYGARAEADAVAPSEGAAVENPDAAVSSTLESIKYINNGGLQPQTKKTAGGSCYLQCQTVCRMSSGYEVRPIAVQLPCPDPDTQANRDAACKAHATAATTAHKGEDSCTKYKDKVAKANKELQDKLKKAEKDAAAAANAPATQPTTQPTSQPSRP